jgi:hydroxymethylpyrimidine/phosphomethylpyrimidine kinase
MTEFNLPRILTIAGSDSGGGAGIQADIKTITALGGYAETVITAITAQNTLGVAGIHEIPAEMVIQQIETVVSDLGVDVIKTGMLSSRTIIEAVIETLSNFQLPVPVVIDPVMVATSGARLLSPDAESLMAQSLFPMATLITPNILEAEALLDTRISNIDDMKLAASKLLGCGCSAVLLKGGHLGGETVHDILLADDEYQIFTSPRLNTEQTHGTGCTLASAIATELGKGARLLHAVENARNYVHEAISHAPGFGNGNGPLNHAYRLLQS